jgi:hypothetical protein
MHDQHAGLSQAPADQRITQQRQQAAQARLSCAAHLPPLPAPRWDLVRWSTSPRIDQPVLLTAPLEMTRGGAECE